MNRMLMDFEDRLPAWVRRLGAVGFIFFMAKGLAWLTVPVMVGYAL